MPGLSLHAPFASAYLLVAQPQSSSTSAMTQLGRMASLDAVQQLPCRQKACHRRGCFASSSNYFPLLDHSDVCELSSAVIGRWLRSTDTIFKQHLAPTPRNVQALLELAPAGSSRRVVILTREPQPAVRGLCERALLEGTLSENGTVPRPWYPLQESALGRLLGSLFGWRRARPTVTHPVPISAVLRAVEAWKSGWETVAHNRPDIFALVSFEQMQVDRDGVLRRALAHWGVAQARPYNGSVCDRCTHARHSRCEALLPLLPLPPSSSPLPRLTTPPPAATARRPAAATTALPRRLSASPPPPPTTLGRRAASGLACACCGAVLWRSTRRLLRAHRRATSRDEASARRDRTGREAATAGAP